LGKLRAAKRERTYIAIRACSFSRWGDGKKKKGEKRTVLSGGETNRLLLVRITDQEVEYVGGEGKATCKIKNGESLRRQAEKKGSIGLRRNVRSTPATSQKELFGKGENLRVIVYERGNHV